MNDENVPLPSSGKEAHKAWAVSNGDGNRNLLRAGTTQATSCHRSSRPTSKHQPSLPDSRAVSRRVVCVGRAADDGRSAKANEATPLDLTWLIYPP